jgi:hypothetical protein
MRDWENEIGTGKSGRLSSGWLPSRDVLPSSGQGRRWFRLEISLVAPVLTPVSFPFIYFQPFSRGPKHLAKVRFDCLHWKTVLRKNLLIAWRILKGILTSLKGIIYSFFNSLLVVATYGMIRKKPSERLTNMVVITS